MKTKFSITTLVAMLGALSAGIGHAQTVATEDFTGQAANSDTTINDWYYFNGACLTVGKGAGTGVMGVTPGKVPSCNYILSSYYQQQNDKDPVLVGGAGGLACTTKGCTSTIPDPEGQGALRFTNGYPYGHNENGAIVSSTPFSTGQGLHVTFKTVTYRGDSGGSGGDGADGMSFYLIDATKFSAYTTPTKSPIWNGLGSWGGSLGYTCSNSNPPYDGLVGGYIGLGIDEYGNFLNAGDNTAQGYGFQPQRIGLRGAGSVSWAYLSTTYPTYYTTTTLNTTALQQAAVQNTCKTGLVWDYSGSATKPTQATKADPTTKALVTGLYDYAPIPNAYSILAAKTIAGEYGSGVYARPTTAIFYDLLITQDGLLSLSYALAGSPAYTSIIKGRSIAATNAIPTLPSSLYFGFAGSSGGSTNVHEIMCFKAAPQDQSATSAAVSQQLATKIQGGAQVYFSYYNPTNWTGNLTANGLIDTVTTTNNVTTDVLTISALANWDAQCGLTGVGNSPATCPTTGVVGPKAAEAPSSRVMLTWNGSTGVPFEWSGTSGNISTSQQNALDAGDASTNVAFRLAYLRGDRSNEIDSTGSGLFRARDGVLADIVDSSPAWIGPPSAAYLRWKDHYLPDVATDVMMENSGQSYTQFQLAQQGRLNVVYVGANDGFLHGFESGSEDATGALVDNSTTPNDGKEVLAYMPAAVLQTIHPYSSDPTIEPSDAVLDYSNSLYAHNFFVDAPPGTGDLFYGGVWHTWLVGGLGAGGSAIYALDVTDPSTFSEANASSLVIGEWNPTTISCVNNGSCGASLGNTYGTPVVRRLHNGMWGVIFGNGYGSTNGDAGIFVMTIDPSDSTGKTTSFYYLSTGSTGANGIAYVTAEDLDGDHITDYVYAGDLKGNVWRFDLTNCAPTNTTACPGNAWGVTPGPLFKTQAGQPITTPIVLASTSLTTGAAPSLMLNFGTGQRTQFTASSPVSYASGQQSLYGIWDWNFDTWNANSAFPNASISTTQAGLGLSSPSFTLTRSNLQVQTFTAGATAGTIDTSNNSITWETCAAASCNSGKFGWYADLPAAQEQIVSTPTRYQQSVIVNSTIPANNAVLSCTSGTDTGYTYVFSPITGGTFPTPPSAANSTAFTKNKSDTKMVGLQTNETGALTVINTKYSTWLVGQPIATPSPGSTPTTPIQVTLPPNITVTRKTWVQMR